MSDGMARVTLHGSEERNNLSRVREEESLDTIMDPFALDKRAPLSTLHVRDALNISKEIRGFGWQRERVRGGVRKSNGVSLGEN